MNYEEADAIAVEHVIYCRSLGMSAREVLGSVGIGVDRNVVPDWDEVILHMAGKWLGLANTRLSRVIPEVHRIKSKSSTKTPKKKASNTRQKRRKSANITGMQILARRSNFSRSRNLQRVGA